MRYLQSSKARESDYNPWNVLRLFWTEDRVNRWLQSIEPTTETVENLFCLAPSVHKYHENAYFALKPVEMSEDETRLTLQFYWLPRINNPPKVRISSKPDIPPIGDRREDDREVVKIWNVKTEKKICSDDQIIMKTIDKERFPLPDPAVLDMQWVLHTLTALSAVPEPPGELYDDCDEDVSVLSLSEDTTGPSSPQQEEYKTNILETTMRGAMLSS